MSEGWAANKNPSRIIHQLLSKLSRGARRERKLNHVGFFLPPCPSGLWINNVAIDFRALRSVELIFNKKKKKLLVRQQKQRQHSGVIIHLSIYNCVRAGIYFFIRLGPFVSSTCCCCLCVLKQHVKYLFASTEKICFSFTRRRWGWRKKKNWK